MTPSERINWVLGFKLDAYHKSVLFVLAYRADATTGETWPSMERLAMEAGVSVRKVWGVVQDLQANGLIEIRGNGGRTVNRYVVKFGANHAQHAGTACNVAQHAGMARRLTLHDASANPAQRADRTGKRTGKGTGAEENAPAEPSIWDIGARMLGGRSLLGKLIREHSEEVVGEAIAATDLKKPADPKSYMLGVLRAKKAPEVPRVINDH